MSAIRRYGRLNVKALVILILVTCVLGGGLVGGHYVRKRVVAKRALTAGHALLAQERWAEACKPLRRYLQQYPDDVATLEAYADAHLAVRPRQPANVSAAAGAYRRLLRHRRGDKVVSHRLAGLYLAMGDYENTQYICTSRLAEDPTDAEATLLLARLSLLRKEPGKAAALLEPLVKTHHPDAVDGYSMLCRIAIEMDETEQGVEQALGWLDLGIENNPASAQLLIDRAVYYRDDLNHRKEPDLVRARADLDAAQRLNPRDPDQRLRLARAWTTLGELERAKGILDDLAEVDDEVFLSVTDDPERFRLDWYRVAGALYRRLGDGEAMGRLADRALNELSIQRRAAFLPMAVELFVDAGRAEAAEKTLDEYLALVDKATHGRSVGDADLAVLRARVATAAGRPYDVINLLRPVVVWNQENVSAWRLLAEAYLRTGQNDLAVGALTETSDRGGGDVATMSRLAREHLRRGDWAEAYRLAQFCEASAPGLLDLKLMRIEAEMRLEFGRAAASATRERLRAELEALTSEHPAYAPVRMLGAMLAELDGRPSDAEAALREAVALRDETMDAFSALVAFLERTGRLSDALAVCRDTRTRQPNAAEPWIEEAVLLATADRAEEARATLKQAAATLEEASAVRDVRIALARLLLAKFDRSEGVALLRDIARRNRADVAARITLLELPEVVEDVATAQRYIDELESIEGKAGLWWRLHQARCWLANDAWRDHADEIREALRYCIESRPRGWSRASLLLGRLHELLGDTATAEQTYREALAVDPNAIGVVDRLLTSLEAQGRFAEARSVLDRVTVAAPKLSGHRVTVAMGAGDFDGAIRELEARVAADPNAFEPRIILASLHFRHDRNVERAYRLLDEASAIHPRSLAPSAARSRILVSQGRDEEAASLLDAEVAKREDFDAYAMRAEFHWQRGNLELAERDYRHLTEFEDASAAGYELLGRFYVESGRPGEAVDAWQRGLEIAPARETIKKPLMKALMMSDDARLRERGRTLLAELLEKYPDDVELLRVHAYALYTSGPPEAKEDAMAVLGRIVERDPDATAARLALIDAKFKSGDYAGAKALVTKALDNRPNEPALLIAAAHIARAGGKSSVARGLARSALDADPQHVPAYVFLIEDALTSAKPEAAAELVDGALAIAPNDPVVRLKQAAILEMTGARAEAIDILEGLLADDAEVNRLLLVLSLADLYCAEGDHDRFEARLAQATELAPGDGAVVETHLRCLARMKLFDAMVPLVSEHHANHPNDTRTLVVAAEMLMKSGAKPHVAAARSLFERVVALDPRSIPGYLGIARSGHLAGDSDAVVAAYRKVLSIDPEHQRALNDLAWVLAESGRDVEEALRLVDQGIDRFPADPHLRDTRGVVLIRLGRFDAAAEELKRAIDFAPQVPTTRSRAMIHLAEAYIGQGRPDFARERLLEAQRIDQRDGVLSAQDHVKIEELLGRL